MKVERFYRIIRSFAHPLSKVMSRVASLFLFFMMLLTIADVFLRKVFSKSILGTVEITEFMMVIVVFFALAQTEVTGSHVKVDVLMDRLSERAQRLAEVLTQFGGFVIFGLITWFTLGYSATKKASGEVSQDLWIPVYPFLYIVAAGCGVFSLVLLIKFLHALLRLRKT